MERTQITREVNEMPAHHAEEKHCSLCGAAMPEDCPNCWSGHVRIGTLEFVWNGYVAKRVDVAWCHACDAAWLIEMDGKRQDVCRDCRARAIAVRLETIDAAQPQAA